MTERTQKQSHDHGAESEDPGADEREYERNVAKLFEEHNQALLRFVSARLHSRQEAKEIAQEAYVRLLKLDEPNTISYLRAYLFRIAANLVSDRLKQRERRSRLRNLVFFEEQELSPPPESILSAQDELAIVQRAILELPAKCQKSFLLNRIHGLPIDVVAQKVGLTGRMVRLHVARALTHCKTCLDEAEQRD